MATSATRDYLLYASLGLLVAGLVVTAIGLFALSRVASTAGYAYSTVTIPAYFFDVKKPGNYTELVAQNLLERSGVTSRVNLTANITAPENCSLLNKLEIALVASSERGFSPSVDLAVYGCWGPGNCTRLLSTTLDESTGFKRLDTGSVKCVAEPSEERNILACGVNLAPRPNITSFEYLVLEVDPYNSQIGLLRADGAALCTYEVKYPVIDVKRSDVELTLSTPHVDYAGLIGGVVAASAGLTTAVLGVFALLLDLYLKLGKKS